MELLIIKKFGLNPPPKIYVFERQSYRKSRQIFHLLVYFASGHNGLGKVKVRNLELHQSLPHEPQGYKLLGHLLFSQAY